MVSKKTLGLLFRLHGAALRTLRLNRQADTWDELGPIPDRLHKLRLGSLRSRWGRYESNLDRYWQTTLVARNCNTLRHLELGFETDAAEDFFGGPIFDDEWTGPEQTMIFGRMLKEECDYPNASMSLHSLKLINCDVDVLLNKKQWQSMDLRNLTKLVLEDCYGQEVFPSSSHTSKKPEVTHCLPNLTTFTYRQKNLDRYERKQLKDFLCSLPRGLSDLSVLLDGTKKSVTLEPILRVHGKTLRTLVWDERSCRRTTLNHSGATYPSKDGVGHLSTISKACHGLIELGLTIDWAKIWGSNESHTKVFLSDWLPTLKIPLLILTSCMTVSES